MLMVLQLGTDARDYRASSGAPGSEGEQDDLMPRKPQPLLRWDIYRAAAKAKWIGEVEAADERAAIEAAAKEFKEEPAKLIAVQRR